MPEEEKAKDFFGSDTLSFNVFTDLEQNINANCSGSQIEVLDSLIVFKTRGGFAYISKPERPREDGALFLLAMPSRKKINSNRVSEVVQAMPGSYMHHFRICSDNDIDGELMKWIRESYEYSRYPQHRIV